MNIDIILTTYNRVQLLTDCLKSVLLANRPKNLNISLVIVDNNSTDGTREIVQPFLESRELAIRYIFVARPGKSAALNEALAQTDGEFVGLIDDDEQLDADWFEIVAREFSNSPQIDYIGGPYLANWEQAPPTWLSRKYSGAVGIVHYPERRAFSHEFGQMLMGGNAVIRRTALQRVLPYPEQLGKIGKKIRSGEDEVIYHRLLGIGALGIFVPELIIHHWIPAHRLTKRYFRKWVIGRGISIGSQIRERGFKETSMLGIPRYQFGAAARSLLQMLVAKSQRERFTAQLTILDCFATLYGRHFY